MEAGYDYLLVNRRFPRLRRIVRLINENPLPYAGAALVVLGLIGVLIGSLFFFVFDKSTEELEEELNVALPDRHPGCSRNGATDPNASSPCSHGRSTTAGGPTAYASSCHQFVV